MSTGVSHAITDGAVLAQLGRLVDASHGGWVDFYKKWGKAPIRQVRVEWSSEPPPFGATVDIGSNWIMRGSLLQTIPDERASAILNLLRSPDTPTIDGASGSPGP
jgi:hypothetical protein